MNRGGNNSSHCPMAGVSLSNCESPGHLGGRSQRRKDKGKKPSRDGLLKISNFILGILLGLDLRENSKPVVMSLMLKINYLICN